MFLHHLYNLGQRCDRTHSCCINLGFAALCHGARWVTSFSGSCSFTRTPGYNLTCHKNDCKLRKDTLWDFNCITNLTSAYQDPILSVATLTHHTGTNLHRVSQRSKRVLLTESSLNISHFTNFTKTCGTWIHCLILSQSLGKSYTKRRPEPSASPTLVHLLPSPLYLTYGMLTLWATHGKAHHHSEVNHDLKEVSLLLSEKPMATHCSTLAWKIPWMEGPGGLQSMGSLGVGQDWATSLSLFTFIHWRRKWQPTPVFLPGESQGQGSLVGCRLWGHTESDMTEAT